VCTNPYDVSCRRVLNYTALLLPRILRRKLTNGEATTRESFGQPIKLFRYAEQTTEFWGKGDKLLISALRKGLLRRRLVLQSGVKKKG
jgi:hypothetical protein